MNKDKLNKAKFLYDIAIEHEKPIECTDDVSLTIQNMLAEIRELGYEEFHYFTDVKLRSIKDPLVMNILLKYYNKMDLFTRDTLIYKIHPKYFPEIVDIAKKEFLQLSPTAKIFLNGFQKTMSRATITDLYSNEMFELLKVGENYAYLSEISKRLCRKKPHMMLPLVEKYKNGVLIIRVIEDIKYLDSSNDVINMLTMWTNITEDEINFIKSHESNRELSVTTYEYYRDLCSVERIRFDARRALKKYKNQS